MQAQCSLRRVEPVQVREDLAGGLDAYAGGLVGSGAAGAVAVALTDAERTLVLRAHGPVDESTMFQIGSIGKSFTAIVALQLVEEGLLDLHAPVTAVLPWFSVGGGHAPITLHHLLTHSSGLIRGSEVATGSNYDVLAVAETETGFEPGAHFWYSNVGYRVVGLMLERATGTPYPQLVRERVLDRLGMRESEPWIVPEMRPRLAQCMVPAFDDRPWRPGDPLVPGTWVDSAEADGCICCSAGDLAAYLRAMMARDERVLSAASWEAMLAPHVRNDDDDKGDDYGYGVEIRGAEFGHSGAMIGTESMMWAKGGLGAVAMATGIMWADAITDAAFALAAGDEPRPYAPEVAEPMADDGSGPPEWRGITGHYRSHIAWLTNFRVAARDGALRWGFDHLGTHRDPLAPLGDGRFRVGKEWSPERLWFDSFVDGVAQRAWLSGAAYHRTFRP
jgi:CubicO group peptidase (beta-lactamase class C family)